MTLPDKTNLLNRIRCLGTTSLQFLRPIAIEKLSQTNSEPDCISTNYSTDI